MEYARDHLKCGYLQWSHNTEEYKNIRFFEYTKTMLVFISIRGLCMVLFMLTCELLLNQTAWDMSGPLIAAGDDTRSLPWHVLIGGLINVLK